MDDAKIARINHLARKSKADGLTEDETREQHALRREYIDAMKSSLRNNLEQIKFVD